MISKTTTTTLLVTLALLPTIVLADPVQQITQNGQCLGVPGTPASGAQVTLSGCSANNGNSGINTGQQWVVNAGNNVGVRLFGTTLCLDGVADTAGNTAFVNECNSAEPQTWYYTGDNRIAITGGTQCLNSNGGGAQTEACAPGIAAQAWTPTLLFDTDTATSVAVVPGVAPTSGTVASSLASGASTAVSGASTSVAGVATSASSAASAASASASSVLASASSAVSRATASASSVIGSATSAAGSAVSSAASGVTSGAGVVTSGASSLASGATSAVSGATSAIGSGASAATSGAASAATSGASAATSVLGSAASTVTGGAGSVASGATSGAGGVVSAVSSIVAGGGTGAGLIDAKALTAGFWVAVGITLGAVTVL